MKLLLIVCAVAIGGALGKPTGEPQAAEGKLIGAKLSINFY